MNQTLKININLLRSIKKCGSDESHTEFNVAIIFRTLLLIDSFHDFTNTSRTNQSIPLTEKLAKHLLCSFKNDLLRIIKINPNINDKDFFEDLLKNDLSIPNFKIYKDPLPLYNKNFNQLDPKEKNDQPIIDRIFNNLSRDNNTDPLLQGMLNPKKSTIGIFPEPTPSFISSEFINTSDIILNKFTGKIQTKAKKGTIYDYSNNPMYIFNYNEVDLKFEFTDNESKVLLCVLHIFLELCVITQKFNSSTAVKAKAPAAAAASLEMFTKKLMNLLGFNLQFRLTGNGYTPWGFIHNIYCSKLNSELKTPPCNKNHYPSISLTIDSESSHASKDYLNTQLEKFFKNKSNPQEVKETREAIFELNKAIEGYNLTEEKTDKEDNDSFAYFLESAYTHILPDESSSFVLARTTATNFDAAPSGNLSKTISRLSKVDGPFSGVVNENSEKYFYDIKVTSGNIPILDFKYSPLPPTKCKLTLTNWFGLSCNKSHETTNSSQGTHNGYSLSKAITNFNTSKDILDIHFKTLTDTGQACCIYGLQKFENNQNPNFVYIFHTLDTFCGAISSIINPGTIIERTDQHKQAAKYGDEEFIKNIYSTYNHVYCSKKTLDKANENIKHFQNYDNFNDNLILLLKVFDTEKKLNAVTRKLNRTKAWTLFTRKGQENAQLNADQETIKNKKQISDELKHAYTTGNRDAHEERDEELLKIKDLDRKKDKSLERHRREEQQRIKDRKSLERHRREKQQRIKDRESLERHRQKQREERKDTKRKRSPSAYGNKTRKK